MSNIMVRKGVFVNEEFDKSGCDHFRIIWDSFRATFHKYARGYEKLKMYTRIGSRLEAISNVMPTSTDGAARTLKDGTQTILLTGFEWDALKQMVTDEEIQWTYHAGEKAIAAIDFVREWPEIEVSEDAKTAARSDNNV